MVRVGFICEGATEKLIVESPRFQKLLVHLHIHCILPFIDAKGNGNLLPHNIEAFRSILLANGAEKMIILTDLDEDQCVSLTKARITHRVGQVIVVAVRAIKAWFLTDSLALSQLLRHTNEVEFPEQPSNAFEQIRALMIQHLGKGTSKLLLARKILQLGFSLENAANHLQCRSAKYLLTTLQALQP